MNNVRLESSNFSDDSRTEGQRQRNLLIPGAREAGIKSKRVGHYIIIGGISIQHSGRPSPRMDLERIEATKNWLKKTTYS
jgi:hypothetical protein